MNDYYKCLKKAKRKRLKLKLLAFFLILDVIFCYVYACAVNLIFEYAAKDFQYYVSNCSYYAVADLLGENYDFSSLCEVERNASGEIVYVSANALLVNYATQRLALNCYDYLSKYTQKGVDVPLGTFSGIRFFSGMGKKVNVKLTNTLSVECKIIRSFTSAGINQTRQVISAVIHSDVTVYSLFKSKYYAGDIEVALCDNVIVGNVPEVYFGNAIISQSKAG